MDDLLPFIRNLCDRIHYTPDETELHLLKKTTVREMSIFFDALSSGGSDKEIFDKMIYFQKLREEGKEKGFKVSDDIPDFAKKHSVGENDLAAKAAMKLAKDMSKDLEGGMNVHVTPAGTFYIIAVTTPASSVSKERRSYEMKLDFNKCENCALVPGGHKSAKIAGTKGADANVLLIDVELGANRVAVGKLIPKWKNQGNGDAGHFSAKANYEVFVNSTDEERREQAKRRDEEAKAREAPSNGGGGGGNVRNLAAMFGDKTTTQEPIPVNRRPAPVAKPTPEPAVVATKTPVAAAPKKETAASSSTPSSQAAAAAMTCLPDETEADGPPEVTSLADNLELKVLTINHGYRFIVINRDATATFTVVFDLSKCDNLKILPNQPDCTFGTKEGCPQGTVLSVVVPPRFEKLVVNLPVDDFNKGSCEMKYVASIKKD